MMRISANTEPINLYAEIKGGHLKQISCIAVEGREGREVKRLVSRLADIQLSKAQELALTNGRLFEGALSMVILNHPGKVAAVFQNYSFKLAVVLESLLDHPNGLTDRQVIYRGQQSSLSYVLQRTLLMPLAPMRAQLGRETAGKEPMGVSNWIMSELRSPIIGNDGAYLPGRNVQDLLIRIKMFAGFGTLIEALMSNDRASNHAVLIRELLQPLNNGAAEQVVERFYEFQQRTRTINFNDSVSRMRIERVPLIDGQPVKGNYTCAAQHGLGFGQVMVTAHDSRVEARLKAELNADAGYANITRIARQGAPLEVGVSGLPERPFMMSAIEVSLDNPVMELYQNLLMRMADGVDKTFLETLDAYAHPHGAGLNRWRVYGTYAIEANLQGLPTAGAQSGTASTVLRALYLLSEKSLYGDWEVVEPATLGIAAFMNFFGHHTFAETIPIGMSMANDEYNPSSGTIPVEIDPMIFEPLPTDIQHEDLYNRVVNMALSHTHASFADIQAVLAAYKQTHEILCSNHPELKQMGTARIYTTRIDLDNQG